MKLSRNVPSYRRAEPRNGTRTARSIGAVFVGVLCVIGTLASAGVASAAMGTRSAASVLNVPVFEPFSGSEASTGPTLLAGCLSAVKTINAAGGVLGHQLNCRSVDSGSDPADAVPAVSRMLTSVPNIVLVMGPGSVAAPTVPVISAAHIPMISGSGSPQYDKNTDKYFYRAGPSDSLQGDAEAYWAWQHGYKTAAEVFTNDPGAQTIPGAITPLYTKYGGGIVKSITLAPDQTSYRTEAAELIAAHPQVIFTETDPQTAATFWSEAVQTSSKLPPVIGDQETTLQPWVQAVLPVAKLNLVSLTISAAAPTAGFRLYQKELLTLSSQIKNPSQYATFPGTISFYDGVVLSALAMDAAKSVNPPTYQPYMTRVTGVPSRGKTVVYTYAQGVAALRAGKTIDYSGAGGVIAFNMYHNVAVPFSADKLNDSSGALQNIGSVPLSVLLKLAAG